MKDKPLSRVALIGLAGVVLCWAFTGCAQSPAIVPVPARLEAKSGAFVLNPEAQIVVDGPAEPSATLIAERLRRSTGFKLPVVAKSSARQKEGDIIIASATTAGKTPDAENYRLKVEPKLVEIQAAGPAGFFYGMQTLLQLFPAQIFSSNAVSGLEWKAPCADIADEPRFAWRGLLLDVARHFFSTSEVKQIIDSISLHKLNRLQLHLTDDQGWRLEIKQHPKLTGIGAWRNGIGFGLDPKASNQYGPDGRYGGFYTHDEIRELVRYARERNIIIVPEIEMPGHASAALAAYPELSCFGGTYSTDLGSGVFEGVYCPGREETFAFLENVLGEVIELFPGEYIHIGGDEVIKTNWRKCPKCQERMRQEGLTSEQALQSYFIRRIEKFVSSKGRKLVGWSEIREGGLPPEVLLMDWIGGAAEAAAAGQDVVMTPTAYCYFDYPQSTNKGGGPSIGVYLPLEKVYAFEPVPAGLVSPLHKHIIGVQANLWTEFIPNLGRAEYMVYPRLCALAEVAWSPPSTRDFADFSRRLQTHLRRLDQLGVRYYRPPGNF